MGAMKLALFALWILSGALALAEPLTIDALTFNIRYDNPKDGEDAWPKREAMVGEWLKAELPDVVGLQEALRHQIDDIREAVPEYAEYGVGRDDGKSKGEHCTILFKSDRFEPGKGGTFWLSDTPEAVASSSWGNDIPRICTWLHLTDKETKRGFYVYNAHWDHRSQPSRERAAELIAKRILERTKKADPIILMGDFNAAEDNPAIATLKKHFVDTYRLIHPDEKFVRTFSGFKPIKAEGGKIDHIFILPGTAEITSAAIERYHRDGHTLSDHFPVRAKLSFKSPEGDVPSSP
jgi:endonuclease/exonuclease/phosphatase family metal-dependent hydrolase